MLSQQKLVIKCTRCGASQPAWVWNPRSASPWPGTLTSWSPESRPVSSDEPRVGKVLRARCSGHAPALRCQNQRRTAGSTLHHWILVREQPPVRCKVPLGGPRAVTLWRHELQVSAFCFSVQPWLPRRQSLTSAGHGGLWQAREEELLHLSISSLKRPSQRKWSVGERTSVEATCGFPPVHTKMHQESNRNI